MLRFLGCAAALLAAASVVVILLPLEENANPHAPALSEVPETFSTEFERQRKLDEALALSFRVREERAQIVTELEAGNIDLDEAIEQMVALRDEDATTWQFLCRYHAGYSSEEIAGYQLLIAAFSRAEPSPDANRALMRRVHAMLKERFGSRVLVPPHLIDRIRDADANP
jgi:hypothetical protein